MPNQESKKSVPIYFYYLAISKQKDSKDDTPYDMEQIVDSFSKMLSFVLEKDLTERRKDNTHSEKVIWLDSVDNLGDGNYNLIFKSAKYNHVRNVIDTETMQELGPRKRKQDGDEEKTHICIRLKKGEFRFLAAHESNHYGITLSCIVDYLNTQFEKYNEESDDKYHYKVTSEIMPDEDFLSSLKKARTMSVLELTVSKEDIKDDFMRFANRSDIADEVKICLKRPKGAKVFPDNLIKAYYEDSQNKSKAKIKKIVIKGTSESGRFEVDTELMKMRHYLSVESSKDTNEVDSYDFFKITQDFIDNRRSAR